MTALTATATPSVRQDVLKILGIHRTARSFVVTFNRPNILMAVKSKKSMRGRGLHSSAFQLNVSAFCGSAFGSFWGVVCGVLRCMRRCLGCILCQKRLRLS